MNDESNQPLWKRIKSLARPYFLVAVLVAFVLGVGVSTLCADTQNKVEAAYSSGLEEGQSTAEASYNSQLAEKEEAFSSQLAQQEEDFEAQAEDKYNDGHSEGFEEGRKEGYSQGQSEAQKEISQLKETIADYEKEEASASQSAGATGYKNPGSQTSAGSVSSWESSSDDEPEPQGGTVYWTPNGKSYHSTPHCTTLKRSKTILSGTVSEAIASGHGDPCNVCH